MSVEKHILQQVQMDNIRTNQIGGKTDGITPEVAEDLGFNSVEEVQAMSEPTSAYHQPHLFEMPGRGHNNPYNETPSRAEILRGMSREDIEKQNTINKLGAQAAKEALKGQSEQ